MSERELQLAARANSHFVAVSVRFCVNSKRYCPLMQGHSAIVRATARFWLTIWAFIQIAAKRARARHTILVSDRMTI